MCVNILIPKNIKYQNYKNKIRLILGVTLSHILNVKICQIVHKKCIYVSYILHFQCSNNLCRKIKNINLSNKFILIDFFQIISWSLQFSDFLDPQVHKSSQRPFLRVTQLNCFMVEWLLDNSRVLVMCYK